MIVRATAIPLSIHPYSSSSRIVHWLTRHHGKISTLLKAALRPKSPFLGEYDLFCTSELLYYEKKMNSLHAGKECSMLVRRDAFRHDWRAMQAASYLAALLEKTTPDEAPQPELFEFFEELLDLAMDFGSHPQFLLWAELRVAGFLGHAPGLANCLLCHAASDLRFCASQGGLVCSPCARQRRLPTLECPPDILAILRAWQQANHPQTVVKTRLSPSQLPTLDAIMATFLTYQLDVPPEPRLALRQ